MKRTKKGFTLIELLVVIAIIALLMGILMPALQRVREQVKRVVCANQVRQQSMALLMYAQQNEGKMPLVTFDGGQWLWDLSYFATDAIINNGGERKTFRCPSNPVDTNADNYWRYSEVRNFYGSGIRTPEPTSDEDRQQNYRVVGYSYLMETGDGRGNIFAAGEPGSRVPDPRRRFIKTTTQVGHHGEMEFVIDTVIKYPDGWDIPDRYADWAQGTSHMEGEKPEGGNIGFLDGHASWRHFKDMYERYTPPQAVDFWW
ncbi:MAG: type II secretion system protein [Deltaproteobacteria bacterium]|nr:type II secretion system protein [Deltaproteobacteria bacterium]